MYPTLGRRNSKNELDKETEGEGKQKIVKGKKQCELEIKKS